MTHRPGVARLAWLLSVVSIATSVAHMAVVRHDRCLEHGELVEVRGAPVGHEAGASTSVAATTASDQHDEHCPLANATGGPVESGPQSLLLDLPAAAAQPAAAPSDANRTTVDALAVAPKQGPPVLAA